MFVCLFCCCWGIYYFWFFFWGVWGVVGFFKKKFFKGGGRVVNSFIILTYSVVDVICVNILLLKDCSELAPEIHVPNGNIVQRTYSPPSVTYGCNTGYFGHGSIQTISCPYGGKWSTLDYRCSISKQQMIGIL